jgi:FAD/FMN-containing dehydrogenase
MNDLYTNRTCLPTTTSSDSCTIGEYPSYVVKAQTTFDIQASVLFASLYNIRLNIKNTGHDFMGRSTAAGSLSIWTHQFQEKTIINSYSSSTYNGPAVRFGSGVQTGDAYAFLDTYGRVMVGGECKSVGFSGGYLPGGGHGPLATMYGMGSDNLLEMQVVTAGGIVMTVSDSQNSDLFWALRGGGAGTFAVTLSVTVKTYPSPKVAGAVVTRCRRTSPRRTCTRTTRS